jgi:hypothetical protein
MAPPASADEYDEWRTEALRLIGLTIEVTELGRDAAGKVLYWELRYRGEKAYAALRDDLAERLGVNDGTLRRWRALIEQSNDLPPASPRVVAHDPLRARPLPVSRPDTSTVREAGTQPPRVPTVVPDEILHPSAHVPKPPQQLTFDWAPTSRALAYVLPTILPEWQDDFAKMAERFVQERIRPQPVGAGCAHRKTALIAGGLKRCSDCDRVRGVDGVWRQT